jgi:hypothetical protein
MISSSFLVERTGRRKDLRVAIEASTEERWDGPW